MVAVEAAHMTRRRTPASTLPVPRQQLGWYMRNVFMSDAREDSLKVLRAWSRQLATTDLEPDEDEEIEGLTGPKRYKPAPTPGTEMHDRLLKRISSRLGSFKVAPPGSEPFETAATYATRLLSLSETERHILLLLLRTQGNASLRGFANEVGDVLDNLPRALSALLGASSDDIELCLDTSSRLLTSGLVTYTRERMGYLFSGYSSFRISDSLRPILFSPGRNEETFVQAIIGRPVTPALAWDDYGHLGEAAEMAAKLLHTASAASERGIHILLMGPPGTGKTEFAAVLAQHAGLKLYSVGEQAKGREPDRKSRLSALQAAHAMLARRRDVVILLDEAEDVLEGRHAQGDSRADMSKAFLNRMLETSCAPTIWTTNAVYQMDLATVRRMSLVITVGIPDEPVRARIWARILDREKLEFEDGAAKRLAKRWAAPAAAAAIAARTARLAGAGEAGLDIALGGVMAVLGRDAALNGPDARIEASFDPELTRCAEDLESLCTTLGRPDAPRNWSMCLSGPPGTGKSAFAHHLAKRLGMPVLQKRASDLLSMWVGGSEKNIAGAFAEAQRDNALLLIDEAEALLFDRGAGVRSHELSQVNEMLTWMERHPLPFVCTTNLPERMDQAVPRRFTFKLRFEPLSQAQAALAFQRILECDPPVRLPDQLTPGDFAVVRRKACILGAQSDPSRLLAWLAEEAEVRGGKRTPIGFQAN